jgi:hypothetical protein
LSDWFIGWVFGQVWSMVLGIWTLVIYPLSSSACWMVIVVADPQAADVSSIPAKCGPVDFMDSLGENEITEPSLVARPYWHSLWTLSPLRLTANLALWCTAARQDSGSCSCRPCCFDQFAFE